MIRDDSAEQILLVSCAQLRAAAAGGTPWQQLPRAREELPTGAPQLPGTRLARARVSAGSGRDRPL
jgi:hypothetical protein